MKFAIFGYGRLGQKVEKALSERGGEVITIIDPPQGYPFLKDSLDGVEAAICFTDPDAGYETTHAILGAGVDVILGTTGFYLREDNTVNEEMMNEFRKVAQNKGARMVYAPNFAIGMMKFQKILEVAARELLATYDPAIMEWHHTRKQDISGTAKKLARIIQENSPEKSKINTDDFERKRADEEITIGVARAGHIPGTHTVTFDSLVDTIELTHRVRDPNIFAHGAIDAAHQLREQQPGIYSLEEII